MRGFTHQELTRYPPAGRAGRKGCRRFAWAVLPGRDAVDGRGIFREKRPMRAVPPAHETVWHVRDEVMDRLMHAAEHEVADIVAELSPRQRGHLAVFCYGRTHLHRIGLEIAATCDLQALVNAAASNAAAQRLYAQSRERTAPVARSAPWRRPITLAKSASGSSRWAAIIADVAGEEPEPAVARL
jgi:hypothetical protein